MPSIIYNDDVEMYDPSYYDGTNFNTDTSDQSTPEDNPSINPYPVNDDANRVGDGWIEDNTENGGTSGTIYPNIPPTEKDPLSYSTKIIKEKTRIVLHDYSTDYLTDLNTQGFRFYAVYTDGTTDEVAYTEIFDPYRIDATTYVNEAYDIANAINQHFWDDTNGVHVTDETKEEWDNAVANSFSNLGPIKQYHNILINSLGMLLRSALNNLVSLSRSGMTVFDGLGNNLQNVLASFTSDGAAFRENGKTRATVTTQGLKIYDNTGSVSNGTETYGAEVAFIGIDGSGKPFSRIGKSTKGYIEIGINSSDHGYFDFYHHNENAGNNATNKVLMAHIGYDAGENSSGGRTNAPYYTFGVRSSFVNDTTIGNYSFVEGHTCSAGGYTAHAEGCSNHARGTYSHAEGYSTEATGVGAHAEGYDTTAKGNYSHAQGSQCRAYANYSFAGGQNSSVAEGATRSVAIGYGCTASSSDQFVIGIKNAASTSSLFIVGGGTYGGTARNEFTVEKGTAHFFGSGRSGTVYVNGTSVHSSDRRFKEHHAYLNDEAIEFIRQLKPALFTKNGSRHVGFYAQDVQEVEPDEWNTETVIEDIYDEELGFSPLSLDYTALIAPLVRYTQYLDETLQVQSDQLEQLKEENEELKQQNQDLMERLNRIERMLGI